MADRQYRKQTDRQINNTVTMIASTIVFKMIASAIVFKMKE